MEFYAHFWTFSSFAQVQKRTEEFLGDQNPSKSKMSSFGLKMSFIRLCSVTSALIIGTLLLRNGIESNLLGGVALQ